jgi:hypothetical protein
MLVRAYEQWDAPLPPPKSPACTLPCPLPCLLAQSSPPPATASSACIGHDDKTDANNQAAIPIQNCPAQENGQCFHCHEHFTNGHKLVCKQLFCIDLVEEHSDAEFIGDTTDPMISMHALMGIQPRSSKTMQVYVDINSTRLCALIDSGSMHNFVDIEATTRAGIALCHHPCLRVMVANGDRLSSPGCYMSLPIAIGGEGFMIECYGLTLGSYEMVLGV